MIRFYYHPSPNPAKVALFLEEAGLEYETAPVDTRKGDQFDPAFLAINPNAKTPALTDGDIKLFDSTAILLYLAEKTGRFQVAPGASERGAFLSWLMLVATGIGPYSGQAVHFRHFAPEPKDYAVNRYAYEAERHWGLIDARLGQGRYMMGEDYTLLDMSVWGWGQRAAFILGPDGMARLPNLARLMQELDARPAAQRAMALASRFSFKTNVDEDARAILFPQNKRLAEAKA